VALNFLQHLSGIATLTRRAVDAVAGTGARVTHTRKTTPGLRALERYAVTQGGGVENRGSLGDAVLWKDNHWALLAAATVTLVEALSAAPPNTSIIVEVEDEAQFDQALAAGVRHILVDNQPAERVAAWVVRAGPGVTIQASGGITPDTARTYAEAGAALISIGALTHSAPSARIRCDIAFT
jgi:nicotinate-nucleotide pyrophosphorylase (carboxylating)